MEQHDLQELITAAVTQATAGLVQQVQDLQQQVQQANAAAAAIVGTVLKASRLKSPLLPLFIMVAVVCVLTRRFSER